jgi:protein SCO1/2
MTMPIPPRTMVAAAVLLAALAGPVAAPDHSHHGAHEQGKTAAAAESVSVALRDLPLLDVDGRQHRFQSELVGDDIVVMDFIYTSCTTVCPVVSAIFAEVQERLGPQLGNGVRMLSLSIDPQTDVPARLERFADNFAPKPGWRFVTGEKALMDQVLIGLGAYSPEFEEHAATILIGDPRRGEWRRLYGFASPEQILSTVADLAAARTS